jgi:hypothetical protein
MVKGTAMNGSKGLCFSVLLLAVVSVFSRSALSAEPADVTPEQFQDPPLEFKSRPLWFWNKPNPATVEIHQQMKNSRDQSGYYGFGILPAAAPEKYLSEEYFARYGDAVCSAAELGMKLCLYDEYWFPSGSAGGQFCQRFPEMGLKALAVQAEDVEGPKHYTAAVPPGALMGVVAMDRATFRRFDITENVNSQHQIVHDVPPVAWKIMVFTCARANDVSLMDYLDADAVEKFLAITHEQYFRRFEKYFGTTIDSAFYDEPPLYRANTWTEKFNDKFQKKYGYSPVPLYPALWIDIGPETAAARNALFGFRAELFATEYIKTMDDWCRAHKIRLTGHMDQEQIVNPTCVSGDLMKVFSHQAIPGVDEIVQFGRTQRAFKLISSAACNWDKPLVMSETFGAMDKLPVDMLYRITMDQYAKGVNLLVPHAVWLDNQKITFPPELSYRDATYGPALPDFNCYVGRLNLLLQGGRHVADIAVLYPIATLHAAYRFDAGKPYEGGPPVEEADYLDVGESLALNLRRDYTFVHPEVLDQRCRISGNRLCLDNPVNHEEYRVVIIPGTKVISASNLRKIRDLYDAGGAVIATGRLPDQSAEPGLDGEVQAAIQHIFGVDRSSAAPHTNANGGRAWALRTADPIALQSALDAALDVCDVRFDPSSVVTEGNLTYIHKVSGDRQVYFFANSSQTPVQTQVCLRGRLDLEFWDPHTGQRSPAEPTHQQRRGQDVTLVGLNLAAGHSLFLVGN